MLSPSQSWTEIEQTSLSPRMRSGSRPAHPRDLSRARKRWTPGVG
jgi:hypothetical protein